MRSLFPIALNVAFGLSVLGIILAPLEFNLPTRILMTFYIVSLFIVVLSFGLTYTIIDIRNILLDIDKNIRKKGLFSHGLSENQKGDIYTSNEDVRTNAEKLNRNENSNENKTRLICPYCGADYSEYPYAKACYNCHKFFEHDDK